MSDQNYKSIAVDHETWSILNDWAEEECRSVGGQIKYMTKKYGPRKHPPKKKVARPVMTEKSSEGWSQRQCTARSLVLGESQRGKIIDTLIEYSDPVTNTELTVLVGELPVKAASKQTAGMYSGGLLKRRGSLSDSDNDRFEYQLTAGAHRLINRRDKKRAAIEKRATLSN
jgi:hypothetical protein